jgi:thiamine-monophosphate kinase
LRQYAHAAMDISDGLVGDLAKMLRASGCGGSLDLAAVPLSSAARASVAAAPALFETAMTGGDDYEILCAVPPEHAAGFEAEAERCGLPVTAIGLARAEAGLGVTGSDGRPATFAHASFSHF